MKSAIVLLSGGLDSAVNLFEANAQGFQIPLVLTFDYGQRAAKKEIESSSQLCGLLKINHQVISLPWFKSIVTTALVDTSKAVPQGEQVQINDLQTSLGTAAKVWVPNRNGIFLNIGAGFAEALGADFVVPGFNAEEAVTFPDNSMEFLSALDKSFHFSTQQKVKTLCFTTDLNKTQIVARAKNLKVPLDLVWSCYFGEEKPCGQCESCLRQKRAMEA